MNKNRLLRLMIAFSAFVILLGIADSSSAQPRREARGRAMTKRQVKTVIDRVEDRVDDVRLHDDAYGRTGIERTFQRVWAA